MVKCFQWVVWLILFSCFFFAESSHHIHNTTDTPEFREIARQTYENIFPCLKLNWNEEELNRHQNMKFPYDAEEHYKKILNITSSYRNHTPTYVSLGSPPFSGPWIENLFISKYIHRPLAHFHGFIPIFIPWQDWKCKHKEPYFW